MKLITRKGNAGEAKSRWERRYGTSGPRYVGDEDNLKTLKRLEDLGSSPNPDDVDRIIGNTSWTQKGRRCHECGAEDVDTVQLGEEPDYDSSTANICIGCLGQALELIKRGA